MSESYGTWNVRDLELGSFSLCYPKAYYPFIQECILFDVYRSWLLRKGDIVIDLGAAVGEFTIPASRKVGNDGLVIAIEPNLEDFELLLQNIRRNNCLNVIPINKGVASMTAERELSFWGRNFIARLDTLENILLEAGLTRDVNFLKMDIEGYETDVIRNDIDIIKKAEIISLEIHDESDKNFLDKILYSHGFYFQPLTKPYCIKKLIENALFSHPTAFFKAIMDTISKDPRVFSAKVNFATGSYIQKGSRRRQ